MSDKELDELDRQTAEKIMGWQLGSRQLPQSTVFGNAWLTPFPGSEDFYFIKDWKPTRNIAQAFEVLEKEAQKHHSFLIQISSGKWRVCMKKFGSRPGDFIELQADSAPLAITRACLAAAGVGRMDG